MVGQQPFPPKADSPPARKPSFMTYEVYVLKSYKNSICYVGSGMSSMERLRQHNKGGYKFTKGHMPWRLIYKEQYNTRSEVMKREKFLKSGQGRKFLDEILN